MISKHFRPYRIVILLFILAAFILRIPILKARRFDPDEFQHLHSARQIYHGQIPYRDYFEHHTPFLHFALARFYPIFGEEIEILFAARTLMMVLTAVILYLTYILSKTLYGTDAGLFAALFLSNVIMFLEKTIEVRPDVPAIVFWLASLIFLIKGIQHNSYLFSRRLRFSPFPPFPPTSRLVFPTLLFILSGLMMGIAIMFTQKTLFALEGLLSGLTWMLILFGRRVGIPWKRSMKLIAIFLVATIIPIALTCIFFYLKGGLWEFVNCNLLMNLNWKMKFRPYEYIKRLLSQNPFFSIISILGLFVATFWLLRREEAAKGSFVAVLCVHALIVGLFIIPVPYRQYYLLFLPLLAMYCGLMFSKIGEIDLQRMISNLKDCRIRPISVGLTILAVDLTAAGLMYTLHMGKPNILGSRVLYMGLWGCMLSFAVIALIIKREYMALVISIGVIAWPLNQTGLQFSDKNTGQLASINHIMKITTEEDTVLDGWSGFGFLRNHAYYYYFLHPEMRAMLSEEEQSDDLIRNLEEKRTKVVIYDGQVKALPKKVQQYIKHNYKPSGHGNIRVRVNRK